MNIERKMIELMRYLYNGIYFWPKTILHVDLLNLFNRMVSLIRWNISTSFSDDFINEYYLSCRGIYPQFNQSSQTLS